MAKGKSKRRSFSKKIKKNISAAAAAKRTEAEPQTDQAAVPEETEPPKPAPTLNPKAQVIVFALMGIMLVAFFVIALLAPDPTAPQGRPAGGTVLWRLLFLLIPLGIMYGLLWWDKALKFIRR
jgi:hypothetical protein